MRCVALAFGLALLPSDIWAQIGNPTGWAPDTKMEEAGVPAPNQTNYQDRLFAQLATAGGMAEVELGKLASDKTAHEGVKRFAERMIDEHGKANDALKTIAKESKIPLSDQLDPDHKKVHADLQKLDGVQFDRAYLAAQIVDHQKTVQLLAWEIGQGEDAELQRFASQSLTGVLEHLAAARNLVADLNLRSSADNGPPAHQ
ncbi:putative membrane protein [Mesorhizobium albiziae]|uniref:Putative membrane protein n=1 Tax=Neomesorhizobium albiziae TaxID=335020 RepID=A0A1I4FD01_9HYPH|nr:DUF4142 domain-containing protein [Mesorhizobium albiziae]GLS30770.1 membrane protein [Mesorhizobium albiziae]SFL15190.1 putative membrane protein [Mesorhizobium albiziae]